MNWQITNRTLLLSILLICYSCARLTGVQNQKNANIPKQMLARQILVTLPEILKPKWSAIRTELAQRHSMTETGEFPLSSIGVDCLVYKVPENQSIKSVIRQLKSDKRTGLTQENQVFEGIMSAENDSFAEINYAPKLTHTDDAHGITTGKDVKIGIIDTGAEKDHPDLKGRFSKTANFVEDGDRSFTRDKHGTAVAGVIGARADDDIGIYGIAPEADLSIFKACWYPEQGDSKAQCSSWTLAKALDAAINNGERVINLSLAGPNDELITKLLESANKRGIIIVAAAQEKLDNPGFPANLPIAIPVISSGPDSKPVQPTWLNRFPNTVAAPGIEVLTTVPREAYDFISGSSLATAHVSGIIALLLEIKPDLSFEQVKALLQVNDGNKSIVTKTTLDACTLIKSLRNGDGC